MIALFYFVGSENPCIYSVPNNMRNQPDVRRWLVNSGYGIVSDEMALFADKYYDLIVAELGKGQTQLTDLQFEFGIGNLRGDSGAFFEYRKVL